MHSCEKENRCTKRRSNGTFNNECDVPTKGMRIKRILEKIRLCDIQFNFEFMHLSLTKSPVLTVCLMFTDISNCTDPRPTSDSQRSLQSAAAAPIYAGAAVGAIIFIVLLFFLVMFLLWKRRRAQSKEDALSRDQIESLLERIVTRSEGDEPYSRKGNSTLWLAIKDTSLFCQNIHSTWFEL